MWAAEDHLPLMYGQLHQQSGEMWEPLCRRDHLQVHHEPGKKTQTKSYMWLYRSQEDGLPIYYAL